MLLDTQVRLDRLALEVNLARRELPAPLGIKAMLVRLEYPDCKEQLATLVSLELPDRLVHRAHLGKPVRLVRRVLLVSQVSRVQLELKV